MMMIRDLASGAVQCAFVASLLILPGCNKNNAGVRPTSLAVPPTAATAPDAPATPAPPPIAGNRSAGAIINCGQLWDKWWVVNGAPAPTSTHPAYPPQGQQTGNATWRCKECHGWDYKGAMGAYRGGSHYTGIPGVLQAKGEPASEIFAAIKSGPAHSFAAVLSDQDISLLVEFIQHGIFEMDDVISRGGRALGDPVQGRAVWEGAGRCVQCHGADGKAIPGVDVADLAYGNPWEILHKIRWGQPGSNMPAGVDEGLTLKDQVDVLTYAQSLFR